MISPNKQQEQVLKSILTSGPLQELELYHINDNYYDLRNGHLLLIDGGIRLRFPKGNFCIEWSLETESFNIHTESFKTLTEVDSYFEITNGPLNNLNNQKVKKVNFTSKEFDFIGDYTLKITKESCYVSVFLEFENENTLQLSLVDYEFEPNQEPKNFNYDISTALMISFNNRIEIT